MGVDNPAAGALGNHSPQATADSSSSGQDELAILPRQTRVLVTGNNRTKRSLVGQEAVVKKAVGLGGWHWLILSNGEEVRLQRNALSVIEYGPADVEDPDSDEDKDTRDTLQIEILTHPRVRRPPRALSPAPEINKRPFSGSGVSGRSSVSPFSMPVVNLHRLDTQSLRRYRRAFQLHMVEPGAPKDALLDAVRDHFATQHVEENVVLLSFVCALRAKSRGSAFAA